MLYKSLLDGVKASNYLGEEVSVSTKINFKDEIFSLVIDEGLGNSGHAVCFFKTIEDVKQFTTNLQAKLKEVEDGTNKEIVRVLRVIEYVGEREAVEECLAKSIHGTKKLPKYEIRAATMGLYPEILTNLEDEDAN